MLQQAIQHRNAKQLAQVSKHCVELVKLAFIPGIVEILLCAAVARAVYLLGDGIAPLQVLASCAFSFFGTYKFKTKIEPCEGQTHNLPLLPRLIKPPGILVYWRRDAEAPANAGVLVDGEGADPNHHVQSVALLALRPQLLKQGQSSSGLAVGPRGS